MASYWFAPRSEGVEHHHPYLVFGFLMHEKVFQTSEGKSVVLKPHLLRHAFATYAVHVEGLPLDLIAKWLQQKNLEVTGYYSEMPEYMQLEQHTSFVARLATHINVREAILRSPEEIQKQAEAARKRAKPLAVASPAQSSAVRPGRDEQRVHQRYLRMSKDALVERLLFVERTLAEQRERWLSQQDEVLTWQFRAKVAETQLQDLKARAGQRG